MLSTQHGELNIPQLPLAARRAHIVPALTDHSLISIGQLCDSGCQVNFNATSVCVTHEGKPIFTGTRNPDTKLWSLNNAQAHAPTPAPTIFTQHGQT